MHACWSCQLFIMCKDHLGIHHVCACESHMPDVTSLGFACDANHVGMMSLGFTFHSQQVGLMWHDVIGVHVV